MKLRVGLISPIRDDSELLKKEFPECHVSHAKNIMEFYQVAGNHEYNAIVLLGDSVIKDFSGIHTYIRSKRQFAKVPIAVLTENEAIFPTLIADTACRAFTTKGGLFLSLIEFFEKVGGEGGGSFSEVIQSEVINHNFSKALLECFPGRPDFQSQLASDDDLHEEFIAQLSDEVATNLLWIKFSGRILLGGSGKLVHTMASLSEEQRLERQEALLKATLDKFTGDIWTALKTDGAIRFPTSLELPAQVKLPYMKKAQNTAWIFRSDVCSVLLELIRYI